MHVDISLISSLLVILINIDFLSQTHAPILFTTVKHYNQFLLHQVVTSPTHFSHLWSPSIILTLLFCLVHKPYFMPSV